MTADANGYRQAGSLPVGAEIYLFGNRKVIDVRNHKKPGYVVLETNCGTFNMPRDMWIAPAGEYI